MLTIEDHFCGAGGNTTGALLVEDVEVVHAANHSILAINTHSSNYPSVEHTCGDIPSMEPKRYPSADVLITTPSCSARSYARGRPKDDPHLFKPGDGLDEKSRATMDEVARWADARRDQGRPYKAIVVENVPQLVDWCEPVESGHHKKCTCGATFRRWLRDVTNLGYEHRKVFLNSAFFPPTPQSRDRIYVVFWRKGQPKPNLDFAPICWCNECQTLVNGIQTPKVHLKKPTSVEQAWGPHDTVWGWYSRQYFYACPRCAHRVAPAITPAITAIEPGHNAIKIGERAEHGLSPLTTGTMARIQRGLDGLPERPFVIPLHHLQGGGDRKPRAIETDVLETMTAQHRSGLVVQVAGNLGRLMSDGSVSRAVENSQVHGTERPLKTLHGSVDRGFVTTVGGPTGQSRNPQHLDEPLGTVTTDNHRALVLSQNDFGERMKDADAAPLPTLPTVARPYVLSNMENGAMRDSGSEPLSTVTTGNKLYAVDPWIVPLRRNGVARRAAEAEIPTIAASGNHLYALGVEIVVSNYGSAKSGPHQQGWARDARTNVIGTHTARDTHAIVVYRGDGQASRVEDPMLTLATTEQHAIASVTPAIDECTFRMLEPSEIARGMVMHLNAYGERYVIHGNRRDRVKQLGNAVTPPVMRALIEAIKDSLA